MSTWPSGNIPTTNVDESTDDPSLARANIETAFDRVNDILGARGVNDGIPTLGTTGGIPRSELGLVLSTTGGTLTGQVTNSSDPGSALETATKQYVDVADALLNTLVKVAIVSDSKTSGTAGGTFTSGSWQVRTLQSETDPSGIVSVSLNQFTLGAGTYLILAYAPAYRVLLHQIRIENTTDTSTFALGGQIRARDDGSADPSTSIAVGFGTIAASKAFEIQHRCSKTRATDGYGLAASLSSEIYTVVTIVKFA